MYNNIVSFADFYRSIWLKVPEVWRDKDSDNGSPLQILLLTFAQQIYYNFYLKLSAIDELFDVDRCPDKYLPFLASMVNWTLVGDRSDQWRQQIKAAPLLYKLKGTKKGLILAEKLVGYSVFISELYRDYTGDFTAKEYIYNNFPASTIKRPWFVTNTNETNSVIGFPVLSDALPSFKLGESYLDNYGNLIIYKTYKVSNRYTTSVSTLPSYNPLTGTNFKSRLSKTSRINVVLKKTTELDDNTLGYPDVNLSGALDLLLKFKPFHLYINNLLVLFDLSEEVYSTTNESLINFDTVDVEIGIPLPELEKTNYYGQSAIASIPDLLDFINPSTNKGGLRANLLELPNPSSLVITSSIFYSDPLLGGSSISFPVLSGNVSFTEPIAALQSILGPVTLTNGWPTGISSATSVNTPFEDTVVINGVTQNRSTNNPWDLSAISYLLTILPSSFPLGLTIPYYLGTNSYINAILFSTVDYIRALYLKNMLLIMNLLGKKPFILRPNIDYILNLKTNTYTLNTFNVLSLLSSSCQTGFSGSYTVISGIVTDPNASWITNNLQPNNAQISFDLGVTWYTIFSINSEISLTLNGDPGITLSGSLPPYIIQYTDATFLNNYSYSLLYFSKSPIYGSDFSQLSGSRNISLNWRQHSKFNRITWAQNVETQAMIASAQPENIYNFDSNQNLVLDPVNTRLFKQSLPFIFTRRSLHGEIAYNTTSTAVEYDLLDPYNPNKWQVYAAPSSYYLGYEQLALNKWSNYFNVPITNTPAWIPYTSIDTSTAAQITGRSSARWQYILSSLNYNDPLSFLCSRDSSNVSRQNIWTRGSAVKLPIPYIGNTRNITQGYRGDIALFTRTDNLSDYSTGNSGITSISKYKYADSLDVDATATYIAAENTDITITPNVDTFALISNITSSNMVEAGSFTKIYSDGTIEYPITNKYSRTTLSYTPQYDGPFDFTNRNVYYTINGGIKPSLYAGNLRTDVYTYSGSLIDESADPCEILISGIQSHSIEYTVSNISTFNKEILFPYKNIYVLWRSVNNGDTIGFGLIQPVTYLSVIPSVQVFRNGIQLAYGDYWTIIGDERPRILLTSNLILNNNDILSIYFDTLDSTLIPQVPTDPDTNLPYDSSTSQITSFTKTIIASDLEFGSSTQQLLTLFFPQNLIISWYDSYGNYINTNVAKTPSALCPAPTAILDTALPNITVLLNGTLIYYLQDWIFYAVPNTISYQIKLLSHISVKLSVGDVITVNYTQLL